MDCEVQKIGDCWLMETFGAAVAKWWSGRQPVVRKVRKIGDHCALDNKQVKIIPKNIFFIK